MKRTTNMQWTLAAAALLCAAMLGCARQNTFADPAAGLYQPPNVTLPPSTQTPADPYATGYAPPGQSYNYGAQGNSGYAPAGTGKSEAEMQTLYDQLYGPNPAPEQTSPGSNGPTTYPGGSSQTGQGQTTNRPATDPPPQNPFDRNPATGGRSNQGDSAQSQQGNGAARPMVPIQRGSSDQTGGMNHSTSLQGPPTTMQGNPPNQTSNQPPVQTSPPMNQAGASATTVPPRNPVWSNSMTPSGAYPRMQVPLGTSPGSQQTAGPTVGNAAGTQQTPKANSVGETGSSYPPGGRWPQKPIPLPRESA